MNPDYKILELNQETNENEYEYFITTIDREKNEKFLCFRPDLDEEQEQLNISNYSYIYSRKNISRLQNKEYEIYYIVDNNYYDELVEEADFNEELVDLIYGIAIVKFNKTSENIIYIELLCKNNNPVINFSNYKPGKELLDIIFEKYGNDKIIMITPLNEDVKKYYCNYKKPLIDLYSETGDFLIYGNKEKLYSLNEEELGILFYSFRSVKYLKNLFTDEEWNNLLKMDINHIKNKLKEQFDNLNENEKKKNEQSFKFYMDHFNYKNIDEILDASNNSRLSVGGKTMKNRKKNGKRKSYKKKYSNKKRKSKNRSKSKNRRKYK
jgi:hypothetical protein